jgi:hypothetical protein
MRRWRYAYSMKVENYMFDHFTVPTGFVLVYVFVNAMVEAYHHKVTLGQVRSAS